MEKMLSEQTLLVEKLKRDIRNCLVEPIQDRSVSNLLNRIVRQYLTSYAAQKRVKVVIRKYVYTIEETAQFIGVNRSTVYRWLRAGKLPGEDIGGVVLIPRWAVEMIKEERDAKGPRRMSKALSQRVAQVEEA